ncbi:MAG: hypothetical protein A3C07_03220 [Candidatus Sungbacteria bacterium RIFCSPHIGHO2_02_FULL_47_11]|uniref:Uncharacterized protein n=1 Tax=Candidatus Sungbacteria bacterium RIFCSPHIGHO2_02_FULL_47_11 TaxID=1802270 RepID=A0A1G2KIT0_9BACT|nr:MAG: hypothetical protein A3C07_03220 [Candidatus Sungbacteria bacterium RIFCSPHIGHO2_02_FULL_47_11]
MVEGIRLTKEGKEQARKEALKKLTSQEYFSWFDRQKEILIQFREFMHQMRREGMEIGSLDRQIVDEVLASEINTAKLKDLTDKRVVARFSEIREFDQNRVLKIINLMIETAAEWGLDVDLNFERMTPEEMVKEIEKAYHARLFELQSGLDEE